MCGGMGASDDLYFACEFRSRRLHLFVGVGGVIAPNREEFQRGEALGGEQRSHALDGEGRVLEDEVLHPVHVGGARDGAGAIIAERAPIDMEAVELRRELPSDVRLVEDAVRSEPSLWLLFVEYHKWLVSRTVGPLFT